MPQQPALYSKLSVAENLRLFARLEKVRRRRGHRRADARADRAARPRRRRGRPALGRQPAARQHRDRPAREPAVLLLDEPSSSLDPRQRERLWEFVGGLAERGHGGRLLDPRRRRGRALRRPRARARRRRAAVHRHARASSSGRSATPSARLRVAPSSASCTSGATERALAAAQGPADPAPLAAAGRAARRSTRS